MSVKESPAPSRGLLFIVVVPNIFLTFMLVRVDLAVLMAGVRAPVSRILPLHFGVMMFRRIMKIHIHEG